MKYLCFLITLLEGVFLALFPQQTQAATISDGYYYIQSRQNTSKYIVVTVDKAIKASDAVDVTSSNLPYEAIWKIETTSDGTQSIKSIVYGTYIQETAGDSYELGSTAAGFNIALYTTSDETNYYNIKNGSTNTSYGLNLWGGSTGTTIGAWTGDSNEGNQWIFTSVTLTDDQLTEASNWGSASDLSGNYKLVGKSSTYGIMKESDGLLYHLAASSDSGTEYAAIWTLTRTGFGMYTIQNG